MEELEKKTKSKKKLDLDKPTSEEMNDDSIGEFYHMLRDNFQGQIERSPLGAFLFNQIRGGTKSVYSKTIRETKVFEKTFLTQLESCFKSISKILKDPKKAIRYEQEVVAMEKAKKVNAETVRHLASHTHFIKKVEENGDIVPSKVLTTYSEDEIGIYENRFIKTLINRICKFLSLRVQILKKNLESYETKNTTVTNKFKVEDTKVKVELSVKMERQLDAQVQSAKETYQRTIDIYDQYKTLRSSKLMQDLKNYKEVTPPILKTNIILKNAEFKVCYSTWVFLDRYTELAFNVNVKEKKNKYPDELAESIDSIMSESVATMLYFNSDIDLDPENMPYREFTTRKARSLSKMDDEYKFKSSSEKIDKFEMSEYFLNKTQEFYQQSLDDKVNSGMEKKYSLELVFREMLEVLNSIYPPLFEMPFEDNYEELPLQLKLERARQKAEVLETITRLKEIDFNNTKRENDEVLAEIQSLEDKIKAQEAREARLAKLAQEKAERAEKRAREREEAHKAREEEMRIRREQREAAKLERDAAKAAEKQRMSEAKAKLLERRAQIKAAQDKLKQERQLQRDQKRLEKERLLKEKEAEKERILEEEKQLEEEKSQLDAKELLRRRREIIRKKAAAEKAHADALNEEDDEEEDIIEDSEMKDIEEQISRLDAYDDESEEEFEDDEDEDDEESVDAKELLRRRREAIRQRALSSRNTAISFEDDEDEEDKVVDARTRFKQRREALEKAREKMFEDNVVKSDEPVRPSTPVITEEESEDDSRSIFERNRDIIRRRALAAQQSSQDENSEEETESEFKPQEDPREIMRRRREAIRQKALEAQRRKAQMEEEEQEEDEDDDEDETENAIDAKELLRRRREAIRQKALEAQKRRANEDDDEVDEDDEYEDDDDEDEDDE